jgi:cell division protein ZapA
MPEIKLSIGGRDFQVACQEGEENFLTDAANLLNSESQNLVSQLGRLSESRMLLMAGLMLADRMINLEKSINEREKQIEQKEIDLEKSISDAKVASDSKPAFATEISELLTKTAKRLESVAKLTSGQ